MQSLNITHSLLLIAVVLLTRGVHAQRGLQYLVCVSVCVSVTTFSATRRNETANKALPIGSALYTGLILIFIKIVCSKVMA